MGDDFRAFAQVIFQELVNQGVITATQMTNMMNDIVAKGGTGVSPQQEASNLADNPIN